MRYIFRIRLCIIPDLINVCIPECDLHSAIFTKRIIRWHKCIRACHEILRKIRRISNRLELNCMRVSIYRRNIYFNFGDFCICICCTKFIHLVVARIFHTNILRHSRLYRKIFIYSKIHLLSFQILLIALWCGFFYNIIYTWLQESGYFCLTVPIADLCIICPVKGQFRIGNDILTFTIDFLQSHLCTSDLHIHHRKHRVFAFNSLRPIRLSVLCSFSIVQGIEVVFSLCHIEIDGFCHFIALRRFFLPQYIISNTVCCHLNIRTEQQGLGCLFTLKGFNSSFRSVLYNFCQFQGCPRQKCSRFVHLFDGKHLSVVDFRDRILICRFSCARC